MRLCNAKAVVQADVLSSFALVRRRDIRFGADTLVCARRPRRSRPAASPPRHPPLGGVALGGAASRRATIGQVGCTLENQALLSNN
jgi:hypothetical protein